MDFMVMLAANIDIERDFSSKKAHSSTMKCEVEPWKIVV
jgi:hypothetical protein